jgi:hypothetical protein
MLLTFGKFKGKRLQDTPNSYQQWLNNQSWFAAKRLPKPLHKQLNGWDGYGQKGEAIYNAIFHQEMALSSKEDCRKSICTCCEDSMYYGI